MGWFRKITRAVVRPIRAIAKPLVRAQKIPLNKKSLRTFNNTYRKVRKLAHAPIKKLPFSQKLGNFVKNPAKKLIPHSIRKKKWYKKYGSKVITYAISYGATAGLGSVLGGTAKAIQTAKNIAMAVSIAQAAVKTRENLQAMGRAKDRARNIAAEQNKLTVESNQVIATQKEIKAIQESIKNAAVTKLRSQSTNANNNRAINSSTTAKVKESKKTVFNAGGAVVGAGTGFFIAGPVGAAVGVAVGGLMKSADKKQDVKG